MAEKFADPNVDESIVEAIEKYFNEYTVAYPHDAIREVSKSENISKRTARKALRKLKLSHQIVPAKPYIGKMRLADQ